MAALAEPALKSLADGGWLAPEALVIVEEAPPPIFEPPRALTCWSGAITARHK